MKYAIEIPKWVSMDQLAERAEVSRATVYRVQKGDERVMESNRIAVEKALAEIKKEASVVADAINISSWAAT